MKKILIKETTREERKKIIDEALTISTLDCKAPSAEDMRLYKKYIDGQMELTEVKKALIEKYTEN